MPGDGRRDWSGEANEARNEASIAPVEQRKQPAPVRVLSGLACQPIGSVIRLADNMSGESMESKAIRKFVVASENPTSITHAARTAAGAVASLLIARFFRLPEAYWAPITSIVVMQSTLAVAISISAQRFAGTAVGAAAGALVAIYFPGSTLAFGLMVLAVGIWCAAFHVDRSAYRYAGITLAIVVL